MLKLPKGLKKKKKGKKSKKKDEELFTEEELKQYKKEHQQQQAAAGEGSLQENEEWSKFKHLTTGIDSVLRKTQGDLDRIKSTSFFQRVPAGPKQVDSVGQEISQAAAPPRPARPPVQVTTADFPQLAAAAPAPQSSESDSSDDEQDDIFDTSYVDAVERGEVKLAYVPDSPTDAADDYDIFDTSHVDALIKGQEVRSTKGKKALDIGVAVEVLTGRIDNVALPSTKRSKRTIPGDLLLDTVDPEAPVIIQARPEQIQKSILDVDEDIPIPSEPIDLSVSLHTTLIQQKKDSEEARCITESQKPSISDEDLDEFTLLATESLELGTEVVKLEKKEIQAEPVLEESWSAFEADKNVTVFAESIVEDQIDILDPYFEQDDPFDTSFAEAVIPPHVKAGSAITAFEEDDDFDPRAEEVQLKLNNRRKSSVRIHLTDPSGLRESITSDDLNEKEGNKFSRDLLGGSTTDLSLIGDSPIAPIDNIDGDYDPFDTTSIDKIVAPGKGELKLLEKEFIGESGLSLYCLPDDPEFDPRAEEPALNQPEIHEKSERRASRPENLIVNKNVVFRVEKGEEESVRVRPPKPVTPYYIHNHSIGEDVEFDGITRTKSDEEIAQKLQQQLPKRRHSEFPQSAKPRAASELLESGQSEVTAKVLTPIAPPPAQEQPDVDPFDTSFAANIAPGRVELKLLAKEFSCEESQEPTGERDLLDPSDDLFQIKALTPEPTGLTRVPEEEDFDPFDTSFASNLHPGRSELKLLESEFLN